MRQAPDKDLVAGALALAYKYVGLKELRAGVADFEASGDLVESLVRKAELSPRRAEKLRRAARLACILKDDAVYGMIALRNRLVGTTMLNACMDECRRQGFAKTLAEQLLEKGVVTPALDQAIQERRKLALEKLTRTENELLSGLDPVRDEASTVEKKLGVLFGEVTTKLMFLTKDELEACLRAEERVRTGLPAEEAPVARAAPVEAVEEEIAAPEADPQSEDEPIKGYQLIERLGVGAMGAVLKALKKDTNETVALKILKPELAKDVEFVQRFNREALAVQALHHPNIIRAVQIGKSGDYHFFAMEFVDGESASKIIKSRQKMPERLSLSVVRQIAGALDHAWKNQIIHRDIKPDNIMVTRDGVAKLTDLGLARTVKQQSTLTITGVVMGSPAYISPEQATGEKNLDTRSDIYALGASLYHMITGEVPYDGDSPLQVMLKHMNDPLPDVRKKEPQCSEGTRRLIFKMMAKRPEGRFQTPRELHEALVQVERHLAGGPAPTFLQTPSQMAVAAAAGVPMGSPSVRPKAASSAKKTEIPASTEDARPSASSSGDKGADKGSASDKKKELGERLRKIVGKKRRG
ncbi:MAG: serine/threonine-protein kinase [Planctomycetota bacterium]